MSAWRSEGWTAHPAFADGPVTLSVDDEGLTEQVDVIARHYAWEDLANLELVRFSHHVALFATAGDVRHVWRAPKRTDVVGLLEAIRAHGATTRRHLRRAGLVALGAVLVLAGLGVGLGYGLSGNGAAAEIAALKKVNVTLRDLPSSFSADPSAIIGYFLPTPGKLYRPATTPQPAVKATSPFGVARATFQKCLGVPNAKDRVYGAAGQDPQYQITSSLFETESLDGMEVASTAQYYATTEMVDKDTREMSKIGFGACFAKSQAALLLTAEGASTSTLGAADNWTPPTYGAGWARGGHIAISVPDVSHAVQLVQIVMTEGHYETTIYALTGNFDAKTRSLLASLTVSLLARMGSTSATAA